MLRRPLHGLVALLNPETGRYVAVRASRRLDLIATEPDEVLARDDVQMDEEIRPTPRGDPPNVLASSGRCYLATPVGETACAS